MFALPTLCALFLLLTAVLPVSADSVWINCAKDPGYALSSTKPTALACDAFCYGYDYVFYRADGACRCSNSGVPHAETAGTDVGGTCAADVFSVNKVSSVYGTFLQCFKWHGPKLSAPVSSVAECWSQCAGTHGHTKYAAFQAGHCACFDSLTALMGRDNRCGPKSTFVWLYGHNTICSDYVHRRRARDAARQKALVDANPFCPPGLEACRIPGNPQAEASYECINPLLELESCGGCLFGTMKDESEAYGVDCTSLPGTMVAGVSCFSGQCRASRCLPGFDLVDGICVSD